MRLVAIALALVLAVAHARAEPALPSIASRGALRVGMMASLSPFVVTGADADALAKRLPSPTALERARDGRQVAGFDVELVAEAARALGVKLEITLVDRPDELIAGLREGRWDLAASALTRTLDRAKVIAFSEPYFASGLEVLVTPEHPVQSIDQLRKPGVRVAFLAGSTAAAFAQRSLAGARLEPLKSEAALEQAMADARVDAVVVDYVTARDAAVRGRAGQRRLAVEERRFTVEQFALAAHQGDPDWVAWLDLFLHEEKTSGAFQRLAARYSAWFRIER